MRPLQGRQLERFDHVQKGLSLDEPEEQSSSVRNMSEDMKRALGALQVRMGSCAGCWEYKSGGQTKSFLPPTLF